jgi:UDPglucose--hexose-1-phosphate uridylyltransferase
MAELRRDPVSGEWIVTEYKTTKDDSVGACPFCPGNEQLTPKAIREYKDTDGSWLMRCFPATNPVFVIEVDENKRAEGLYDKMGNVGAHEIIVENRSHTKTLSSFTEKELLLLLEAYMERISDLKKDKRFKYVQVFKNHGELAGSYVFHPHSHLLATPIMPHKIEQELVNSKRHYLQKGRCLFCDVLNQEMRQNKRVVSVNSDFVALCPFASKFPYEVWLVPRLHSESFEETREEGVKRSLAAMMLDTMKRVEKLTNAYTIIMHTSPNMDKKTFPEADAPLAEYFHWHIEILPRDFKSSKYKQEDEFYVISITPEEAAKALKEQAV